MAEIDPDRIAAALEGRLAPEELTPEENAIWFDAFAELLSKPTPKEIEFFARRRRLGLGVGLPPHGDGRKTTSR